MSSVQATELTRTIQDRLADLAAAVEQQRASDEFRQYLDLMARFHKYSFGNCLLIAMAKPNATMVAGFNQWKRLGRMVKQGEKAIRILAPCPVRWEDPDTGNEEERVFFKAACVFDVSQTEGRSLPSYALPEVRVEAAELLHRLEQVAAARGIAVTYRQLGDGYYGSSRGGSIEIASGHSTGQQAKSLAHELAHESLHRSADGQIKPEMAKETRELEAESVAYVVCRHFGLDVEMRASRYITAWGGDAKALGASLSRISGTAREMIEGIEVVRQHDGKSASEELTQVLMEVPHSSAERTLYASRKDRSGWVESGRRSPKPRIRWHTQLGAVAAVPRRTVPERMS